MGILIFRPIASFLFLAKVPFLAFLNIERDVCGYLDIIKAFPR